ncbi:hypothetical protein P8V03_02230 [Clostridium sp. A1-XYC3]|uniref:KTSC domain-containing protein n=1 Tax=Clostridium tanneri TaxID=3037988 RepID=A0ABU4JPC6_9CLOT|nr:hypothetical protein [Clostridium sp. A1-XYC3]MDW8799968.1 hypothetical protein [Clostridium sp. A1-XYC3]
MTMLNEVVEHIVFGSGVVTEAEDHMIWVKFQDEIGTKIFLYPEAFEKFLKAENPAVENYTLQKLRIKQDQIEQERREKEREAAELQEQMRKISIAKKEPARSIKKKS